MVVDGKSRTGSLDGRHSSRGCYCKLVVSSFVTGRHEGSCIVGGCAEADKIFLAGLRGFQRNGDFSLALRSNVHHALAAAHHLAVFKQLPVDGVAFKRGEVEAVFHFENTLGSVNRLESNVAVGIFHFSHGRVRVAVGVHDAVAQEVGIRRAIFAVVAAVGEIVHAVFVDGVEALVNPVPDETALQIGVGIYFAPLVPKAAGGVAHCVGVFRRANRAVAAFFAHLVEPTCAWILRHNHVGVPLHFGALVAHRAVHEGLFVFLKKEVALIEVIAVASFVAQRPDGDARVILVAHEHVVNAFEVLLQPVGVVAQGLTFGKVVIHAVAFDVSLVVDVEAVFVAEFVETAVLRIVAQAHGVDVVTLHQLKVAAHEFFGHIVSGGWVMLVDVHAFELDRLTVDEQRIDGAAVWRTFVEGLYFDSAEAHVLRHKFHRLAFAADAHHQFVEVRSLARPGFHLRQVGVEVCCGFCTGTHREGSVATAHHTSGWVE